LPGEVVHQARKKGYILLFAYRIFFRPIKTYKLVRNFSRHMKFRDVVRLILSPFRKIDHHKTYNMKEEELEVPVKMVS